MFESFIYVHIFGGHFKIYSRSLLKMSEVLGDYKKRKLNWKIEFNSEPPFTEFIYIKATCGFIE